MDNSGKKLEGFVLGALVAGAVCGALYYAKKKGYLDPAIAGAKDFVKTHTKPKTDNEIFEEEKTFEKSRVFTDEDLFEDEDSFASEEEDFDYDDDLSDDEEDEAAEEADHAED